MLSLCVLFSLIVSGEPPAVRDDAADRSARREARREQIDAARTERLIRSYQQRTLGQHPFVGPQFITSALPTSHFGLGFGAGAVFPRVARQQGAYLAGAAGVDAGLRLGKWVGLNASVAGLAGVARNPDLLLDVGAAAAYSWEASVIVRTLQRATTALSLRPQIHGFGARGLALRPGFDALKQQVKDRFTAGGDPIDLAEASRYGSTRANAMGGLIHLALAQSLSRFVGLQVGVAGGGERESLRFYDGEYRNLRSARGLFESGLALSVDTHPIPIAILAEYNLKLAIARGPQRGEVAVAHELGGGLYFNALTQTLGVSLAANLAAGQRSLVASFGFRGYF